MFKYNVFLWCAAVFSASLLQSSVSRDLQKSLIYDQETFLIIINVENSYIFVETVINVFSSGYTDEQSLKEQHLFEI